MSNKEDRINKLYERLDLLQKTQDVFNRELQEIRAELALLKGGTEDLPPIAQIVEEPLELVPEVIDSTPPTDIEAPKTAAAPVEKKTVKQPPKRKIPLPSLNIDFEKFIGENLINKVGIVLTIIGVAIGAKYSIDNNLINPETRIILGYLAGIGLLGFGMKLKKKYEGYSAVLVSGAMAIMYFITFAAYSFYGLFPQLIAFILMVIFTIFTVVAALNYNKQVIALIGLVGAYAVPVLLSNNSGQVEVLFSYVAIINIGILFIAVKKYWKGIFNVAFVLTWLIFSTWFVFDYKSSDDLRIALIFLVLFFVIFYVIFLAFKFVQQQKFGKGDIAFLLANSFIFYGLGYVILSDDSVGKQLLGVFTLANGVIHFAVSSILFKKKLADRNLFYFITGLVLVFITMAIPVQLDGNWVTLLWAGEAAILFWVGRTKGVTFYEKLSYPLMFLAGFSLLQDWSMLTTLYLYNPADESVYIRPIFNIHFLSGILFLVAFGFINYINQKKPYVSEQTGKNHLLDFMNMVMPAIFLIVLYGIFKVEIDLYWNQLYESTKVSLGDAEDQYGNYEYNRNLNDFRDIWTMNYSLLFLSILSFINIKKWKHQMFGYGNLIFNVLLIFAFLGGGLFLISEIRESYLDPSEYFQYGIMYLGIRYISILFFGLILFATYKYTRSKELTIIDLKMPFELLLHLSILWIISSELLHWMDIGGSDQSYKLGLSILWGSYALIMVALGIWKRKKHLRIAAIALFAITLVKLFFYDIGHLSTIARTVVLVSLGVLLLVISFLYNKYTEQISDGKEKEA